MTQFSDQILQITQISDQIFQISYSIFLISDYISQNSGQFFSFLTILTSFEKKIFTVITHSGGQGKNSWQWRTIPNSDNVDLIELVIMQMVQNFHFCTKSSMKSHRHSILHLREELNMYMYVRLCNCSVQKPCY